MPISINNNINNNINNSSIINDNLKFLKTKIVKMSCFSLTCIVLGIIVMAISLKFYYISSRDLKYHKTDSIVTNYYTKSNNRCCVTTYNNICREYSNHCINGYVTFNYLKNNTNMKCDVIVISNKLVYETVYNYIMYNFAKNSKHEIYINNDGNCVLDDESTIPISAFIALAISMTIFIVSLLLCILSIYYNRKYKEYKTHIETQSNDNLPAYTLTTCDDNIDRGKHPDPPEYNIIVNIEKETIV